MVMSIHVWMPAFIFVNDSQWVKTQNGNSVTKSKRRCQWSIANAALHSSVNSLTWFVFFSDIFFRRLTSNVIFTLLFWHEKDRLLIHRSLLPGLVLAWWWGNAFLISNFWIYDEWRAGYNGWRREHAWHPANTIFICTLSVIDMFRACDQHNGLIQSVNAVDLLFAPSLSHSSLGQRYKTYRRWNCCCCWGQSVGSRVQVRLHRNRQVNARRAQVVI